MSDSGKRITRPEADAVNCHFWILLTCLEAVVVTCASNARELYVREVRVQSSESVGRQHRPRLCPHRVHRDRIPGGPISHHERQ